MKNAIRNIIKADRAIIGLLNLIENSGIFRLSKYITGFCAIVVMIYTFIQIGQDLNDRIDERSVRRNSSIERNWNTLTRQVGGLSGKAESFNYLVGVKNDLFGIDLSCRAVGRWADDEKKCLSAPIFRNIDFISFLATQPPLRGSFRNLNKDINYKKYGNFDESIIENTHFPLGFSKLISLRNSIIRDSNIYNELLLLEDVNFTIEKSSLHSSVIDLQALNKIHFSDISGSTLIYDKTQNNNIPLDIAIQEYAVNSTNWAWDDSIPGIVEVNYQNDNYDIRSIIANSVKLGAITLCDHRERMPSMPGEKFRKRLAEFAKLLSGDKTSALLSDNSKFGRPLDSMPNCHVTHAIPFKYND